MASIEGERAVADSAPVLVLHPGGGEPPPLRIATAAAAAALADLGAAMPDDDVLQEAVLALAGCLARRPAVA